jgi:putative ABC transport system permease protein
MTAPLRRSLLRLLNALRPGHAEPETARELASHLALLQDEYARRGLTPDEAHRAARRAFGGVAQARERHRDARSFVWFEDAWQDLRCAVRMLAQHPGFLLVVVVTLALGIGANTAIFSLVNAVRAGALPYANSDRLVQLSGNVMRSRLERRWASYPDYLDWRAQATSFTGAAAFDPQRMTLAGSEEPERIDTEFVSAPYFSLLGVAPARGRTFRSEEDAVSDPTAVVVISDGLWKRRFGADPQIVGRTITLSGGLFRAYTVVGLMPPGFRGITDTAELWLPFSQWAPAGIMNDRAQRAFAVLARLKPGVTVSGAQAELNGISRQLERAYPETNTKRGVEVTLLDQELLGRVRPLLWTLLAAVALVLLIACANVTNLLVARSEMRRRETAVRRALGAGRGRLVRQLVTESCVLTTAGAAVGLLLARLSMAVLMRRSPVIFPSYVVPGLDVRVAAFTIVISLLCGILVSLAPAFQGTGNDLNQALKESARTGSSPLRRIRHSVIVAEISLAVVLLVGAGLMIRSVRNLAALHPGFDADAVLTVSATIPFVPTAAAVTAAAPEPKGGTPNRFRPVVPGRVLLDRVRAVSGVVAAALSSDMPLDGNSVGVFYTVEGQPSTIDPQARPRAYQHRVSPEFFRALRIPIVRGRSFADSETSAASNAIVVSESLARRFWPREEAIGRRLRIGEASPLLTIVGIVGDVKYRRLPNNPDTDPDLYLPFADRNSQVAITVRTAVPPESLSSAVRAAVRSTDASIIVSHVGPMRELVQRQASPWQFVMWLMGVFAAIALALAIVGIYGVLSYMVNQRTREIGVRMALGASRIAIVGLILNQTVVLIGVGLGMGLGGAAALTRSLQALLFGVTTFDPPTFGGVAALFGLVGIVASYLPARRATRVDPLVALRAD